MDLTSQEQAEVIAEKFAEISQEYDKLKSKDIDVPEFKEEDIPKVTEAQVEEALANMDTNKSTVEGDIPAKVLKHFSKQLAKPVSVAITSMIRQGCWPDILKLETVTPVPKENPPSLLNS